MRKLVLTSTLPPVWSALVAELFDVAVQRIEELKRALQELGEAAAKLPKFKTPTIVQPHWITEPKRRRSR